MTLFAVGGRYRNRQREYGVLEIRGDELHVRYDDGTRGTLSAQLQSRIIENMQRDASHFTGSTDRELNRAFFRTVGYLATHTERIEGFARPNAVQEFARWYRQVAGRDLLSEDNFYQHSENTAKWGMELRVEFIAPSPLVTLEFGDPSIEIRASPRGEDVVRVNSNRYVEKLIELGFTFQSRQDEARIRVRMPAIHLEDFDQGAIDQ